MLRRNHYPSQRLDFLTRPGRMTALRGSGKKEVRRVGMTRNRSIGYDLRPVLAGNSAAESVESDNAEDVETAYFDNLPALRQSPVILTE